MLCTTGEFVEILEFDVGNEESGDENEQLRHACMCENARFSATFDDCPTTGNLIEILRFTHFARVFKFNKTSEIGRKKEISNGVKVSVVMELV